MNEFKRRAVALGWLAVVSYHQNAPLLGDFLHRMSDKYALWAHRLDMAETSISVSDWEWAVEDLRTWIEWREGYR